MSKEIKNMANKEMTEQEIFKMVFDHTQKHTHRLSMQGTLVYYDNECEFNTQDFTLMYNLYRLGKVMENHGEFE